MADEAFAFPLSMGLLKTGTTLLFATEDELVAWAQKERSYWQTMAGHQSQGLPGIVRANLDLINNAQYMDDSKVVKLIKDKFDLICSEYIKSQSVELISSSFNIVDVSVKASILGEFKQPGSVPFQLPQGQGHPAQQQFNAFSQIFPTLRDFMFVRMTVCTMKMFGNPQRLTSGISEVEERRSAFLSDHLEFKKLIEESKTQWDEQIQEFRKIAALKAPKEYWGIRSTRHENMAKSVRRWWFGSVAGILLFLILFLVLMFTSVFSAGAGKDPIGVALEVERSLIILGILAVLVWWSRQLLRDLRGHEHLCEDAAERVTMIETFAALSDHGLLPTELTMILTALYRPAAAHPGEDSGPVLPYEIIVKAVGDLAKARSAG